jgi:uncharacterized protein UPF0158
VLDLSSPGLDDPADDGHGWLISPQTGEVAFWTTDAGVDGQAPVDLDELVRVCLDPLPCWVWYQGMAGFAGAVTDERAGRGRLARAIQGKGAFRPFKDELHDECLDLLPAWRKFCDVQANRWAVQWLADASLIGNDAVSCFLPGPADPDLPLRPLMPIDHGGCFV